jgi:hypothetical protein
MRELLFEKRKELRSLVIHDYLLESNYKATVIFSCGNASEQLKRILKSTDIKVLDIAPQGALSPSSKWWTPEEVHKFFPEYFDATSGHLPLFLMARISECMQREPARWLEEVPQENRRYLVPTGSGETILTLRWAFPTIEFVPLYNVSIGSEYNTSAPLNQLVGVPEEARQRIIMNAL